MKIKQAKEIEEESIGDITELEASISADNISLVLKMAAENLYSNPIGSLIREVTSNALDANVENNVLTPIEVNVERDYDSSCDYLTIKDNGIGINPDRMANIFMKYFSSTKRDTNTAIGGWGLGSKSPLAYQDIFYITTICNHADKIIISDIDEDDPIYKVSMKPNIKYEYIYFKTADKPKLSLLSSEETKDTTGTTIRIDIKDGDASTFSSEFIKQLSYFEGVYIKDKNSYYNNDFKLYEGEYFKYNSITRPYQEAHICVGQVSYPIDWSVVNEPILNAEIAIKFDIGELEITLNRENIQYDDDTINTIKERIAQAREEISTLYASQSPEIEDLREYFGKRRSTPLIKLNSEGSHALNPIDFGLEGSHIYAPLSGIRIPNDIFSDLYNITRIKKGNISTSYIGTYDTENAFKRSKMYIGTRINKYDNIIADSGYVLTPKKAYYQVMKRLLHLESTNTRSSASSFYVRLAQNNKSGRGVVLGKAHIINKYIKHIRTYLLENCNQYDIADEEWIANYKAQQKVESPDAIRRANGVLLCYDADNCKQEIKYSKLNKNLVTFYIVRNEEEMMKYKLSKYRRLISKFSPYNKNYSLASDKIEFIIISKTRLKDLKYIDNVRHVSEFFDRPAFQDYFYRVQESKKYAKYRNEYYSHISKYYEKHRREIDKFYRDHDVNTDWCSEQFENRSPRKRKFIGIEENVKAVEYFLENAGIFNYIDISNCPKKELLKVARMCKITKLNNNFYKI
jgi:hypothetical protein